MATWKAKCACTGPDGRYYAEGETAEGPVAPCVHFALVGKADPAPAPAEADPAPVAKRDKKSKPADPLG